MKTKENGVTLIALVTTIILLLILVTIGTTVGTSTIDSAKFTQFKTELKVMQSKVNELNQSNEKNIGLDLSAEQKNILNIEIISNVIYKDTSDKEKEKIQSSFRYCNKECIQNELGLDSIERDYLISVEYRYVIYPKGFEYEGTTYYMIDQIENEIYNVRYNDKNEKFGSFDVNTTKEDNKWKIEISNIQYNGYVDKWQVKYKLDESSYWETSNDLSFYVKEDGKYNIKVVHGEEIDLGSKDVFAFEYNNGVNSPELLTGMAPIKFTEPTDTTEGTVETTTYTDDEWYDYTAKNWANSQTKDGSMWVWIPRYAYKITYYTDENKKTVSTTKTQYGSIDVKFLIGTTDNYYDENGEIQTAKRQKTVDETIDTTTGYTVHPAFTNESSINYANGGWNKELAGIWVAKFEAGYASGNNSAKVVGSAVNYTQTTAYVSSVENDGKGDTTLTARNWLDGEYETSTAIKYPTFQGLTYSMNYINHNDAYNISKNLTGKNNIYGLSSSNADSHLIKNSEWGAVAYLSQSQYGLNGTNIYINNANLNNSTQSVYAVTGCCGKTEDADPIETTIGAINNRAADVYVWTQKEGQKASSTGTIYGIYDLSGGTWERTAALVANGNGNLTTYGSSLINVVTKTDGENTTYESTAYVTVYPSDDSGVTDYNTASQKNYEANAKIYGDAIRETSTEGTGGTSWYSDYSNFTGYSFPFFHRGGYLWVRASAGLFCFSRSEGLSIYYNGFRAVLVAV